VFLLFFFIIVLESLFNKERSSTVWYRYK